MSNWILLETSIYLREFGDSSSKSKWEKIDERWFAHFQTSKDVLNYYMDVYRGCTSFGFSPLFVYSFTYRKKVFRNLPHWVSSIPLSNHFPGALHNWDTLPLAQDGELTSIHKDFIELNTLKDLVNIWSPLYLLNNSCKAVHAFRLFIGLVYRGCASLFGAS